MLSTRLLTILPLLGAAPFAIRLETQVATTTLDEVTIEDTQLHNLENVKGLFSDNEQVQGLSDDNDSSVKFVSKTDPERPLDEIHAPSYDIEEYKKRRPLTQASFADRLDHITMGGSMPCGDLSCLLYVEVIVVVVILYITLLYYIFEDAFHEGDYTGETKEQLKSFNKKRTDLLKSSPKT